MVENIIIQLAVELLWIVLLLSLPTIIAASFVGLMVSFVQALTQIQDQTLQFLIKLLTVSAILVFTYSWMGMIIFNYTNLIFSQIKLING